MFYDTGCYGKVELGPMPADVERALVSLPGEWLEYDTDGDSIVVRHIQPTSGPSLPTIAGELVRILSEVPAARRAGIRGGDLFVHSDQAKQLVRLRVEPGGALHVRWASPDYAAAPRHAYTRGREPLVDPRVQRLNGQVRFAASDAAAAVREIQAVADGYEGLYPEGEVRVEARSADAVQLDLADVNLDAEVLVEHLVRLAKPGSLGGCVEVASFADEAPERFARFVFEGGTTYIQRPALWASQT